MSSAIKKPPPKMENEVTKMTISIQRLLQPLINDVTTLENENGQSKRHRKNKPVRAEVLLTTMENATKLFIDKSQEIANLKPQVASELAEAIAGLKIAGQETSSVSRKFVSNPCESKIRDDMVQSARKLLAAVTRVLIIADMDDVKSLIDSISAVHDNLENLKNITNQDDLLKHFKTYDKNVELLYNAANKRQQETIDPRQRDNLAAARVVLKKYRPLLQIASQTHLQLPNVQGSKENRDLILKEMCHAVETIEKIATEEEMQNLESYSDQSVATEINDLDQELKKLAKGEKVSKQSVENTLHALMYDLNKMSQSDFIPTDRRNRLIDACQDLKTSLHSVLSEFETNLANPAYPELIKDTNKKMLILKRKLGKAVDQDSLLETTNHLNNLINAAKSGNPDKVEIYANMFAQHNERLFQVATLLSNMTNNQEGAQLSRYAAEQVKLCYPQLINAARILVTNPESEIAHSNMTQFGEYYTQQVQLLMDAFDEITTINDFLSVTDNQILEDMGKCLTALQAGDLETFSSLTDNVKKRIARITKLATDEMDNYSPSMYTKTVLEAVRVLNEKILPKFNEQIEEIQNNSKNQKDVDDGSFIDSFNMTYNAFRDIRIALLMITPNDQLDPDDVELEQEVSNENKSGLVDEVDEYPEISGVNNARDVMAHLPEAEKKVIQKQVETFHNEYVKLDQEVLRWNDQSNNLVILAKQMASILNQMTEFTSGQGPLKTTLDLIQAAQRISEAGNKFEKLTIDFVNQCSDATFSDELVGYTKGLTLYCQQLKITSAVKADVEVTSGELKVSGVESASSLLKTSKNLMTTVVKIVQIAYMASLKNRNKTILWRMKLPQKKPLVIKEKRPDLVRKASIRPHIAPVQILNEYDTQTELHV